MSQSDIARNLSNISQKILLATQKRKPDLPAITPRLVAVSKTKPKEAVIEAYSAGQRYFGENYVQEIVEKGNDDELLAKCPDIKWHFVGHLQKNKVKKLLLVPNLDVIETVHSLELAVAIDQSWAKLHPDAGKLKVFAQINTSGEAEKSGCKPDEAPSLSKQIVTQCPKLDLIGLMTIGRYDNYDEQIGVNPDFQSLLNCRQPVADAIGKRPEELELSMGMSGDFEHAIEVGATSVRVGQLIFGARDYSKMH